MEGIWIIVPVLGAIELFLVIIQRIFVEKALHSRGRGPICEFVVWATYFVVFNFATYVLSDSALFNLFSFCVTFLFVLIYLYKDKLRYCIYVTIFLYVTGVCSEVLSYYLQLATRNYIVGSIGGYEQLLIGSIISKFVWFFLIRVTALFVGPNRVKGISILDLLEAGFVPMGSVLIMFILVPTEDVYPIQERTINKPGWIGAVVLLVINIATYYLYEKGKKATEKRMREEALQEQCNYYMRQCEESKALWMELSKFRHDIKQEYMYLQILLKNGSYGELQKYYEQNLEFLTAKQSVASSGNIYFDSILNYKAEIAERDGIVFLLELDVPHDCVVDGEEISICFGNLLDNAIEAVRDVEKDGRKIVIRIKVQSHNLYIEIRNPYESSRNRKGENYITTKSDVRSHGWGLQIIRDIVERHHGEMEITDRGKEFCIKVLLYQVIDCP